MSIYYIEKHLIENNGWKMVKMENDKQLAILLMDELHKENPNTRYRVTKYIDSAHVSINYIF